jgi:hypothetical protein
MDRYNAQNFSSAYDNRGIVQNRELASNRVVDAYLPPAFARQGFRVVDDYGGRARHLPGYGDLLYGGGKGVPYREVRELQRGYEQSGGGSGLSGGGEIIRI